jgi:hypothetical protein
MQGMHPRSAVLALIAAGSLAACIDTPADDSGGEASIDDATVFTETVISVGPDGKPTLERHAITAGEERRQNAARLRAQQGDVQMLAKIDWSCAWDSFWLYDTQFWMGNRICFKKSGDDVELAKYGRAVGNEVETWQIGEGSYFGGRDFTFGLVDNVNPGCPDGGLYSFQSWPYKSDRFDYNAPDSWPQNQHVVPPTPPACAGGWRLSIIRNYG